MSRLYRAASFEEAAKAALVFCIKNRRIEEGARDSSFESPATRMVCIRLYEKGELVGAQLVYEADPEDGPLAEARAVALPRFGDCPPAYGITFCCDGFAGFVPSGWNGTADDIL